MYHDLESHIADLVNRESPVAVDGRIAQDLYPDLKVFRDIHGGDRWCAASANPSADRCFTMTDNEGRVWMMPYVEERGIIVHSDPPMICVARNVDQGFGLQPEPGWEDVVAQLHPNITRIVKQYLLAHPPVMW